MEKLDFFQSAELLTKTPLHQEDQFGRTRTKDQHECEKKDSSARAHTSTKDALELASVPRSLLERCWQQNRHEQLHQEKHGQEVGALCLTVEVSFEHFQTDRLKLIREILAQSSYCLDMQLKAPQTSAGKSSDSRLYSYELS